MPDGWYPAPPQLSPLFIRKPCTRHTLTCWPFTQPLKRNRTGAALAVVLSWERNKSIFWAVIAGVLSWVYVIYFALTPRPEERKQS